MSSERVDPLANYQCQTQYSHQQSSITAKLFGFPLRAFRQCHYFLSTSDGGSQSNTELQHDSFLWPGSLRRLSWTWCRSYVVGCGDVWIFKSGSPRVMPVDGTMVGEKGKQLILELLTNSQNALPSTLAWDGAKWVVQPVLVKLSLIEILQCCMKRERCRIYWVEKEQEQNCSGGRVCLLAYILRAFPRPMSVQCRRLLGIAQWRKTSYPTSATSSKIFVVFDILKAW